MMFPPITIYHLSDEEYEAAHTLIAMAWSDSSPLISQGAAYILVPQLVRR